MHGWRDASPILTYGLHPSLCSWPVCFGNSYPRLFQVALSGSQDPFSFHYLSSERSGPNLPCWGFWTPGRHVVLELIVKSSKCMHTAKREVKHPNNQIQSSSVRLLRPSQSRFNLISNPENPDAVAYVTSLCEPRGLQPFQYSMPGKHLLLPGCSRLELPFRSNKDRLGLILRPLRGFLRCMDRDPGGKHLNMSKLAS